MLNKMLIAIALLAIASCSTPSQNNTILQTSLPISATAITTTKVTATPSFTGSNTPTAVQTPDLAVNIPRNALIAYSAGREIGVIPATGGASTFIIQNSSLTYYYSPSWSPSGHQIAFGSEGDGISSKLNIINRDGTNLRVLR